MNDPVPMQSELLDPPSRDTADAPPAVPNGEVLDTRSTCEWILKAHRASVLIDAAAYYAVLRKMIPRARHSIFILGWDIDSRIELVPGGVDDGYPPKLSEFLCAVLDDNPQVRI